MRFGNTISFGLTVVLLAACSSSPPKPDAAPAGSADHEHASHMGHVEPDEKGRQLYGMKHAMDPDMLAEMATKPAFNGYTEEQIAQSMRHMGPNYTWYSSPADLSGDYGVLILAHGFGEHGDTVLRDQLQTTATVQPLTFSYGMSMMMSDHIQLGLNDLTDVGAESIVVIPVVSTRHNTLMRQWEYIFGTRPEPEYGRVPRVTTDAGLLFAPPLNDHPLVGEILIDHANEISTQQSKEVVIIVGHGPVDPEDNRDQLRLMDNLADMVRAESDYARVEVMSMQDDAAPEVRTARIRELREMVIQAQGEGYDVLIVSNLLGTRIVQSGLRRALRGLDYKFNTKGLIQHPNFIVWIDQTIDDTISQGG